MNKKKMSLLVGIIIGIVIASAVGVSASILYQASEIGFTPNNPNWQVNNLESALNDLYINSNSGAYGDFTPTDLTVKHIDVGFRPSKLIIYIPNGTNYCGSFFIYNLNNDDVLWAMWYSSVTPIKEGGIYTSYDKTKVGFSVDSTGFNYKPASDTALVKTYWFAFK